MQQVLFIGGGNAYPSREDFIEELKKWDYDPFEVKKKMEEYFIREAMRRLSSSFTGYAK